jgi:hypothetical protein
MVNGLQVLSVLLGARRPSATLHARLPVEGFNVSSVSDESLIEGFA